MECKWSGGFAAFLVLCLAHNASSSAIDRLLTHSRIRAIKEGPNMCAVQQIENGKKYFSSCQLWYRKKICNRPATVSYECCPGYVSLSGQTGCPAIVPLNSIYKTVDGLGIKVTKARVDKADLGSDLDGPGAYTFFLPTNEAWERIPAAQAAELEDPAVLKSLLLSHAVNKRLLSRHLKSGSALASMQSGRSIYVQQSPNGILTVNCVRVIKPNILATNGVLHMVDGIIPRVSNNIRKILEEDSELSTLKLAIQKAGLMDMVTKEGPITLLAPTNAAFEKVPVDVMERILKDPTSLKALVTHHLIRAVHCSEAILSGSSVDTVEGSSLVIGCDGDRLTINAEAVIEQRDIVATNGVLHKVSEVFIPDSAKTAIELTQTEDLSKFSNMFSEEGLQASLRPNVAYTLLAPNNEAFTDNTMEEMSTNTRDILLNHVIKNQQSLYQLYGGQTLDTLGGRKLRVFVYPTAICIENACLESQEHTGRRGAVFVIRNVLRTPSKSIMDSLESSQHFSILVELIKAAGLKQQLSRSGTFTIFAPTNEAFASMTELEIEALKADPDLLENILKFHMLNEVVVSGGIANRVTNFLTTRLGGSLEATTKNGHCMINGKELDDTDQMATNGVIHSINTFFRPKEVSGVSFNYVHGMVKVTKITRTFQSYTVTTSKGKSNSKRSALRLAKAPKKKPAEKSPRAKSNSKQ
ncbi:transforming growth factor-beta-induced protein ig-h3-like [Lethenteron reissneri]|uniref:transforming growth factor-beta-induced protein ig-h3-like n=1 Tax=Lethenteron reissneri TaxID=7753 RepID=UPI002AB6962C|nr:transforming growth factor-beta-induced protein ig-h3-like [Lethenteron reissneri]